LTKQTQADLMILFVTMCWGISYYMINLCTGALGPFALNACRFLIAFAFACMLFFPKLRAVNKVTVQYSVFGGIVLAAAYLLVTLGVTRTSLSNAGFMIALMVVFTPLLSILIYKKLPEKKLIVVVLMCLFGIALMTLNEEFRPASGDILCLACAIVSAGHLLFVESVVRREDVNVIQFSVYQILCVGLLFLPFALFVNRPPMPDSGFVIFSVFFLAIFCTAAAFIVQPIAQQHTSATRVGIIFTLEPIFAGVVAFFLAGEVLLPRAYLGALIMLLGLFLMEIDLARLKNRIRRT